MHLFQGREVQATPCVGDIVSLIIIKHNESRCMTDHAEWLLVQVSLGGEHQAQ